MAKKKTRGKGNRKDKERPLLTVQGVLRLEKSFITAQHDDAPTMVIQKADNDKAEMVKLVPGMSEHDLVQYKAGYAVGPSNPNPQTEAEAEILEEQRKVEARVEAFETMKSQVELERKQREEVFKKKQLDLKNLPNAPPGTSETPEAAPEIPKKTFNPDDPGDYELPAHLRNDPAFHNDSPLEFGFKENPVSPPADKVEAPSRAQDESVANQGSERQELPEDQLPQMMPLPSNQESDQGLAGMVLDVAMEMEEKRKKDARERIIAGNEIDGDHDIIYSLDEITQMNQLAKSSNVVGPELNEENIQNLVQQVDDNSKMALDAYWQFVRENPQDFNGWCYLVQHAENMDLLDEVRSSYNDFLALYPYCYAYWQRYSDIEKKHEHWERALAILHRGLEAIPLSVDLWLSYLELYHKMYETCEDFEDLFRTECERAIQTVGLEYNSNSLWDYFIDWELGGRNLRMVTGIYKRLIAIPTRLYNKHWDNFVSHVRNHHPRDILEYDEYDELRRVTCQQLDLTYRPDPVIEPAQKRKVVQPEDKLKAGMKERIVASVVTAHELCEEAVEKRLRYEEKIKRTYFHVKPLDLKQLKNWDAYLDFEISQGDHDRVVILFERCLIPCAHYEKFWAKYARYLHQFYKNSVNKTVSEGVKNDQTNSVSNVMSVSPLKKARWAFGTGLTKVDEIRDKRCTWTLRGWKEKDEDGNEIMKAEQIPFLEKEMSPDQPEETKDPDTKQADEDEKDMQVVEEEKPENSGNQAESVDHQKAIDTEMFDVCKTSTDFKDIEAVRDVYKRACIVHCTKKPIIHLKWAAFEEECGNLDKAREILLALNQLYPLLLECCMQLIDIERRSKNFDQAEEYYKKLIKKIPQNRKTIKAWVSMKLARFQFKVCGQPDKALSTLRNALKRERGDPKLYSQIIDVCYQRHPVDVRGVTASIDLALKSTELTNLQKFDFVKRKVEFMQEFGDVKSYHDACNQLKQYRHLCSNDLKIEAKKRKELQKEEEKFKELEKLKVQIRADANMKAKIAQAEGRLLCTQCHISMFPDEQGYYEFERERLEKTRQRNSMGQGDQQQAEEGNDEDGVIDLMDMEISADQEEQIKKTLEEKTKYKEVAPTWELNMEEYGYGKRRKVYDPDYEHVENSKFREYERLEIQGYGDELKDRDHDKPRNMNAPGLGSTSEGQNDPQSIKVYTTSDFIIPPKVPQLQIGPAVGRAKPRNEAPGVQRDATVFELPPEIANPQESPCVNVPEWFVKEGGELCLSDTTNGISILRYWPKFMSEKGNHLMFNQLRQYCKWHQKQVQVDGEWKYETRLVAWYGPCDYDYSGLHLEKNTHWAPELLDLLHRLIAMTKHEFNSCFLNLYRDGHDMCGWHADVHPQLGRHPSVASVSLGAVRVFQFRKKNGPPNFIRFPLFPGSLLLMEGATQEDWLHCLPTDVNCKEERINLTFRTMYSINKR